MTFKPSLGSIAKSYHSDKGYFGPSNLWSGNNYVDTYEAYLRDRSEDELTMLEIGIGVPGENWDSKIAKGENIQGGASLKMWYDYLPKAQIYAVDINPATHLENERIKTFIVDQGDPEQLKKFKSKIGDVKFDFIIDDGSHRGDHQQISLEHLWPLLKHGGYYFIEDLNDRGFGEKEFGRHGTKDIVSTRKFFLEYLETNTPLEPNAFVKTDMLDEIADIRFHTPMPKLTLRHFAIELIRKFLKKDALGISQVQFADKSFKMVALKKS